MTGKRRVAVLALSPQRTRVLVSKRRQGRYDIPDSALHWPGGKRLKQPKTTAANLLSIVTHGTVDPDDAKEWIKHSQRHCLPTGGFGYTFSEDLDQLVECANRVNKYLKLDLPVLEMKSVDEVCTSHAKYGGGTIEAVRSMSSSV